MRKQDAEERRVSCSIVHRLIRVCDIYSLCRNVDVCPADPREFRNDGNSISRIPADSLRATDIARKQTRDDGLTVAGSRIGERKEREQRPISARDRFGPLRNRNGEPVNRVLINSSIEDWEMTPMTLLRTLPRPSCFYERFYGRLARGPK
jgi:hypothetical protein